MNILLTGGASDLAQVLTPQLLANGHTVTRLDIRRPADDSGEFIQGSITDREMLGQHLRGVACVVHIAAWHGIHEVTGQKDVFAFWDVNVTGTFNTLEMSVRAGVKQFVYISSTSVDERFGVYGHTKVLGEEIARTYAARHGLKVMILRPRAFIPHWNRATYSNYIEWAHWFWGGAVHIDDVAQATRLAIAALTHNTYPEPPVLVVDGAYDYTPDDLAHWDADGPGSTFRRVYPGYESLVRGYGLDPARQPKTYDISQTRQILGYDPQYSLHHLLLELAQFGESGPPVGGKRGQ
ncbi:MAG: NAD(P)-dependent oxidoreductase [Candidatus Promineifilaceae bacterium]